MRRRVATLFVAGSVASTGCDDAAVRRVDAAMVDSATVAERARADSIVRSSPGYVIDSMLPVEEELRRFRAALGDPVDRFSFGAASRSALVDAFVTAIERNDTTSLARLVVDRREFAYLVYPTSPNVRPPYRQSPQVVWLQRSMATNKGASRLLQHFGGRALGFISYTCPDTAVEQGENRLWEGCVVERRADGGTVSSLRMFGPIVERGRRYKFLSLANGL